MQRNGVERETRSIAFLNSARTSHLIRLQSTRRTEGTMKHPLAASPRATLPHLINAFYEQEPNLELRCHVAPSVSEVGDLAIAERVMLGFLEAHKFEESLSPTERPNSGVWR